MFRGMRRTMNRLQSLLTVRTLGIVAAVLAIYVICICLYIYFIAYSRSGLMGHEERVCNKCRESTIPRIMHHTWITHDIPEKWHTTYNSCLEKHKDYKHMLWSHDDMDKFIQEEYTWFFPLYKSYPYQIQRAASFRYFIMYHFGGLYVDLDIGCKESLHNIMANLSDYNVILAETKPTGITNAFQASVPKHLLYQLALTRLKCSSWWHGIPYVHVMFATGPMFFTGTTSLNDNHDVYILRYHDFRDKYFWLVKGGSWQVHWDSWFFLMMDKLPFEFWNVYTFIVFILLVFGSISCCVLTCRYRQFRAYANSRHAKL